MLVETRQASWWDSLRLQLFVSLPTFIAGVVVPRRWFLAWQCRRGAGRRTMRFLAALREKYGCDHLWTWFPLRRTLLVFAPETMEAVLASRDNAGDPCLKKRAVSRFAPEAVVISSGEQWEERRPFNVAALALGQLHPQHDAFRQIVVREAGQVAGGELRFPQFQALGQRISQQVILGAGELRPDLGDQLARLLARSNLLIRDKACFASLYAEVDGYFEQPRPQPCLVHEAFVQLASGSARTSTRVPAQVVFWLFVLKDAIELHVARTLALIAAHPNVQAKVRDEVHRHAVLTSEAIHGLTYLGACLREQLRLWTPVPLLLRRATTSFDLRDAIRIEQEQQILIHAGFYHRDPRVFGERANAFVPDAAMDNPPATYFFSAHRRGCAGRSLVTFVLTATLASLLARFRFELAKPQIDPSRIAYLYDHFALSLRAIPDA